MGNQLIATLAKHEAVIEKGLGNWLEVSAALVAIRDRALFRGQYESFTQYCATRWGFGERRRRQLISSFFLLPEPERHPGSEKRDSEPAVSEKAARNLGSVDEGDRQEVLDVAKETAKSGGAKTVTAKHVTAAKEKKAADAPLKDATGKQIRYAHVKGAFVQAGRISKLVNQVHALRREIVELADDVTLGQHIIGQKIETDMGNVAATLRFGIPHAICPWCKGKKCEHCKNAGWVPKDVYERAPAEMKA